MLSFQWEHYSLTESQIRIADYIQKHQQQVLLSTEKEIAEEVGVSIATVSRFWNKVGFVNLKAFKHAVREELAVSPAGKMKNVKKKGLKQNIYLTLEKSVELLQETIEHIDPQKFNSAIELLQHAENIYVLAQGPSKGLGELLVYRIRRFGKSIHTFQCQGNELFEEMIHLKRNDVVILFGFARLLPEVKVLLQFQREIHYHTILITDQLVADYSHSATVTLFASRGDANEFHSMIAPTLLLENIMVSLGMREEDKNIERLEQLTEVRKRFAKELPR
ncbi:transcriptional regulator, RpiR family [Gracilibacillus ureilyticus]|uniref:Transcriptional regulator, RpiR family n=1 Tax=Gracilibacillus ureilyticus TaxID=531814 RepID=A0A1H9VK57_9BACI|nr:MurR/RpiR family transcriptional regulator [Gracilibacillus ureilyticus]SES21959.1 transcriptional regulator, RpiR family [Gracilibacillus ureilyticus]